VGWRANWSDIETVIRFLQSIDEAHDQVRLWRENALRRSKDFSRTASIARFRENLIHLARGCPDMLENREVDADP